MHYGGGFLPWCWPWTSSAGGKPSFEVGGARRNFSGLSQIRTVTYGHDSNGNQTSVTYPSWASTSTVTYGFDHASELTSAIDFNGNGNVINMIRTADGLPASQALLRCYLFRRRCPVHRSTM